MEKIFCINKFFVEFVDRSIEKKAQMRTAV